MSLSSLKNVPIFLWSFRTARVYINMQFLKLWSTEVIRTLSDSAQNSLFKFRNVYISIFHMNGPDVVFNICLSHNGDH